MRKRTKRLRQIALVKRREKHEMRKRRKVTPVQDTGVYFNGITFVPTPNRMAMFRKPKEDK